MNFLYLLSGFIFAIGLGLSGMIEPEKVRAFLSVGLENWNIALLFVLGAATPVYGLFFFFIRRRGRHLLGGDFPKPPARGLDKKLILGSVIFGVGWGLIGLCPGPALVRLAWIDLNTIGFLVTMYLGFEVQRKLS
jgi:uncharacterized protein